MPRSPELRSAALALSFTVLAAACGGDAPPPDAPVGGGQSAATAGASGEGGRVLAELWNAGQPAFGIFVPDERPRGEPPAPGTPRPAPIYTAEGAADLARNPLYDFVFLNLEGSYDPDAVTTLVEGLKVSDAAGPTALLVRIPTMERDGEEVTRARVHEVLERGADGVVIPHIRSVEEARLATTFFAEVGADVWTPSNGGGSVIAMLMVEDPDAVAQAAEIADLGGYSVLACGIGSLTSALGGDREAAEAGNMQVLAEATRRGLADMITADPSTVERRVQEGFLGLLMSGPTADEAIRLGRAAAGR